MAYDFNIMVDYLNEKGIRYSHSDSEAYDGTEDYDALFEELSRLSEGDEDTIIEWVGGDDDANSIEFKIDGVVHEFIFPIRTDYFQTELFDYINSVLSSLNKSNSFFELESPADQSMIFVYGDKAMYDEFRSRKWLQGQFYSELYGEDDKD